MVEHKLTVWIIKKERNAYEVASNGAREIQISGTYPYTYQVVLTLPYRTFCAKLT